MAWGDLAVAFPLYLILEGIFPFLSPDQFRKYMGKIASMSDSYLRRAGLTFMGCGIVLLYLVR
ncbi:MAG: DUF2065 family protein [Gammaproteobacteria bacterium]|nr:DUF2065 family protein [Gammaproteobacteria bacterium]